MTRAQELLLQACAALVSLTALQQSAMADSGSADASTSLLSNATATEDPTEADPMQACVTAHSRARQALQQQTLLEVRPGLRQCSSEGCPLAIRSECGEWLTLAERQAPTLVFSATTDRGDVDSAKVFIDGQLVTERLDGRPLEAPLGPRVVVFELPDGRRQELRIVVAIGEKDRSVRAEFSRLQVSLPLGATQAQANPPTRASSSIQRDLGLALGLLSLGGAIATASLLYFGIDERDATSMRCTPNCSNAEISKVRRWFILSDIAGFASAVTGGVGIYLFVSGAPNQKAPLAGLQWQRKF